MSNEKLSPMQSRELEIMKIVLEVFTKEHIHYYMVGGTMLGAIRHKGFIPWDDDIDIGILRPDYERFISVCSRYFPEHIKLRTYWDETDHHYYFLRVVDTRYYVKRLGSLKERLEEVWVDIFPLDGFPSGRFETMLHKFRLLTTRFFYHVSCFDKVNIMRSGRPPLVHAIVKVMTKLRVNVWLDRNKILNRLDRLLKKYPVESSDYIFDFMGAVEDPFRSIYRKTWFGNGTLYPFEDIQLIGPSDYDSYLKREFGNYMSLPPTDQRNIHADVYLGEIEDITE